MHDNSPQPWNAFCACNGAAVQFYLYQGKANSLPITEILRMPYPTDKSYSNSLPIISQSVISTGLGNIWLVVEKAVVTKKNQKLG